MLTVTVVIPCLNEERYAGLLLEDLINQTLQANAVIVADCHSTDKTVAVAESFRKKLPLQVAQSPYKSAAAARNSGAKLAQTDFLLFLDADMRLPNNFIEKLLARQQKKDSDFVSPYFHSVGHHPFDHLMVGYLNLWVRVRTIVFRKVTGIGGAMLVRTSVHRQAGGYNPKLREFDDIDYCARLTNLGIKRGWSRKAVAIVSNRRPLNQGRFYSLLQGMTNTHWAVRYIVRPLMKRLNIRPKWHEHEN